jgi:beta-galactosidase
MRKKWILWTVWTLIPWSLAFDQTVFQRNNLFDDGWRFHRGGALGAEAERFDDSGWREVDLPHDWSIEDIPGTSSPFDSRAINQVNSGFTVGGTGWYRKSFSIPDADSTARFALYFEGSYNHTIVWVNGREAGRHFYGYTSFGMDITPCLAFGKRNTVAVKVMNEGENNRWYSGSGLYRHVWLIRTDRIHVPLWGIDIMTPEVSSKSALVSIKTKVRNAGRKNEKIILRNTVLDAKGRVAGTIESAATFSPDSVMEFIQNITVQSPRLWSAESPNLYTLASEVVQERVRIDSVSTSFGIRSASFSPYRGFLLNGEPLKLKGGCVHHDNGPLGARAYDRAEERRIELLKSSGFNAVRCSHNPPSPAFLNACDRLGMLVIDEAFDMWTDEKNPLDYHLFFDACWRGDLESMVLRDRNHPSVIMWSIGNEIIGTEKTEMVETARRLAEAVRGLDPSRPVTMAVNRLDLDRDPIFSVLDVAGYNYERNRYVPDHERNPGRVIVATESFPLESFEYWTAVTDHPWVIGDFTWTAIDYIGEASIGWRGYYQKADFFPWNLAYCGDIDICGWKRPQSFYRDALWKTDQLSVLVTPPVPTFPFNPEKEYWSIWNWVDAAADWNWEGHEAVPLNIQVYSSCDEVELKQDGRSLGKKPTNRSTRYTAEWKVPYGPGVLQAVGYRDGKPVRKSELRTAGKPAEIRLSADRTVLKADNQDLSYITVELADRQGIRNPKAEDTVRFEVTGPVTIAAVGNGNPVSLESFQRPERKAWQGRCLVIVKSGRERGEAALSVSADGLPSATVRITVK